MDILVSGNELKIGDMTYPCTIGKNGYSNDKRESDGCTPIGRFFLREVYYRADRIAVPLTKLKVKAIGCDDGWCDSPEDEKYNQHVYLPYAASHEELWREDHLYDLIVVVGYNDDPVLSGAGSAIFVHVAAPNFTPTRGCVGLELPVLQTLVERVSHETTIDIKGA